MARATEAVDWEAVFAKAVAGERVTVRLGKDTVAVVPAVDLERLEEMDSEEEEALRETALAAWAEHEAAGRKTVSLEELKARYGL